nr:hypothetical protein [Tanacetum cinerariifolium]
MVILISSPFAATLAIIMAIDEEFWKEQFGFKGFISTLEVQTFKVNIVCCCVDIHGYWFSRLVLVCVLAAVPMKGLQHVCFCSGLK